jgi:hypothetical protein
MVPTQFDDCLGNHTTFNVGKSSLISRELIGNELPGFGINVPHHSEALVVGSLGAVPLLH